MRQRARVNNLTVCYSKKKPVTDNEFRHNIVNIVCGSTRLSSDNVMSKFTINNSADACTTDVNLLNWEPLVLVPRASV